MKSHLIGIMISKTIGFRGFPYFQTHPYRKNHIDKHASAETPHLTGLRGAEKATHDAENQFSRNSLDRFGLLNGNGQREIHVGMTRKSRSSGIVSMWLLIGNDCNWLFDALSVDSHIRIIVKTAFSNSVSRQSLPEFATAMLWKPSSYTRMADRILCKQWGYNRGTTKM